MDYKVLIIEDEKPAARRLQKMLAELNDNLEIVDVIDSVEDATTWLKNYQHPDIVFMDIQLADGLSFSIFDKVKIEAPIIFTTAYDEYAIKAFKVNSIDYLLKPIEKESLEAAWQKFKSLKGNKEMAVEELIKSINREKEAKFKERFLIKLGDNYTYCNVNDVAYFTSDSGFTQLTTWDKNNYIIDEKLDGLEKVLAPNDFFRINRKFIIHLKSITKISSYFNSRLILQLKPICENEVIVARDRVSQFKKWLNR